jgi:signal transduction histidine kinase
MASSRTPVALWHQATQATLANPVGFLYLFRWLTLVLAIFLVANGSAREINLRYEPGLLLYAFAHLAAGTAYSMRIYPRMKLPTGTPIGAPTIELIAVGVADMAGSLALMYFSGGWGSPFWHFAVTAIMVPSFLLGPFRSVISVSGFAAGYAFVVGLGGNGFDGALAEGQRSFFFGNITTAYLIAIVVGYIGALFRTLQDQRARTRRALDDMEVLFSVAEAVVQGGPDSVALTGAVAQTARNLTNISNLSILLVNDDNGLTVSSSTIGLEQLSISLASEAASARETKTESSGDTAGFAVPLIAEGQVLGVLLASVSTAGDRGSSSAQLVETLATQVAIGLQNATLARQKTDLAAQEERARIAREIHDGIAQAIFMLSLQLETSAELADRGAEGLPDRLRQMVALSKETLLEVRHYIFDLKPYLAGQKGVGEMLVNQVNEFKRVSGLDASVELSGEERPVSVSAATCLYRVTQEVLANALKHSGANHVQVTLRFDGGHVRLDVVDDGRGFEVDDATLGHGIGNINSRVTELGGKVDLVSTPGQGTRVLVDLPV